MVMTRSSPRPRALENCALRTLAPAVEDTHSDAWIDARICVTGETGIWWNAGI